MGVCLVAVDISALPSLAGVDCKHLVSANLTPSWSVFILATSAFVLASITSSRHVLYFPNTYFVFLQFFSTKLQTQILIKIKSKDDDKTINNQIQSYLYVVKHKIQSQFTRCIDKISNILY